MDYSFFIEYLKQKQYSILFISTTCTDSHSNKVSSKTAIFVPPVPIVLVYENEKAYLYTEL